jgi:hypothetical protein
VFYKKNVQYDFPLRILFMFEAYIKCLRNVDMWPTFQGTLYHFAVCKLNIVTKKGEANLKSVTRSI